MHQTNVNNSNQIRSTLHHNKTKQHHINHPNSLLSTNKQTDVNVRTNFLRNSTSNLGKMKNSLLNDSYGDLNETNSSLINDVGTMSEEDFLGSLSKIDYQKEFANQDALKSHLQKQMNEKFSDTYREVIKSLLHDKLISLKSAQKTRGIHVRRPETPSDENQDALESLNNFKNVFSEKQNKHHSQINLTSSIKNTSHSINSRTFSVSKQPTKSYNRNVSIDLAKENSVVKIVEAPSSEQTKKIDNLTNRALTTSDLKRKLMNTYGGSNSALVSQRPYSCVSSVSKSKSSSASIIKPIPSFRLTDYVFNGYERFDEQEEEHDSNNQLKEETFKVTQQANKKQTNQEEFVTPSYKIKKFDLSKMNELEMAKRDIYKRYSFMSDASIRQLLKQSHHQLSLSRSKSIVK